MATAEKEVKSNRREMEAAEVLKKSVQAMQDQLQVLKCCPANPRRRLDSTSSHHRRRPTTNTSIVYFESRVVIRQRSARRSQQGKECYVKVNPLRKNLAARKPSLRKPSRPLIRERQKNWKPSVER
uniref:Uncharacterized protein n=1 Tax=Haemonchus contortus TaxID=6289 RepID=A0A7I4Y6Q2_HAECO